MRLISLYGGYHDELRVLRVFDLLGILVTLLVSLLPSLVDWVLTGPVAITLFEMMCGTLRAGIRSLFLY